MASKPIYQIYAKLQDYKPKISVIFPEITGIYVIEYVKKFV